MNQQLIEAYPLQWPHGWKRTSYKKSSKFKIHPFGKVRNELFNELRKMGSKNIVLSTNIPLRLDGLPYAKYSAISDTGVAVYFLYKNKAMVFACDSWKTIEENIISITKTIEAIRGIERWGASEMLERAFTGFTQLEAPSNDCWSILGIPKTTSVNAIKEAWKNKARANHPDRGGSTEIMAKINRAYDEAMESLV